MVIGAIVTALWAGMYIAATIDKSLAPMAGQINTVAVIFIGFLFGTAGIKLIRGGRDDD
jgi:hypothetical protein